MQYTSKNSPTHFSSTGIGTAEKAFREAYPDFTSASILDELRATEYARLDELKDIYLDYTGGGLYADCQIRDHMELLRSNVFGNPHSLNPTSRTMTELCDQARSSVLKFFNASPDEYTVIFTSNASNALKLVGEAYPFKPEGQFLLLFDNHNSVNGIREFARTKGATITYLPVIPPELRVEDSHLISFLTARNKNEHNLFAYPAQSNFTGVQHPLEWIKEAHARGWDVLVDCAAFVPTNRLDLSRWQPDYVPISFYKMFGYPTGVGCLLARKQALAKLQRPWFAGGTIWGISVQGDGHVMLEDGEAFEDGTINYLNLPAIEIGLKYLDKIGIDIIHTHVMCLTSWLLDNLLVMRHSNGTSLVQVYGPHNCHMRGGNIALNFLNPDGSIVDERIVEQRASKNLLSLRTGCFCNPGAGEVAFHLSKEKLQGIFKDAGKDILPKLYKGQEGITWDQFLANLGMQSGGAVRVSLGLATNFADAYRFMQFAETFIDNIPTESDLQPRVHC
jgi:molybdenum cofactor sulfurtransferase